MNKKQALIFGTTGTIGNALARLLSPNYNITGIVRTESVSVPEYIDCLVTSDFSEQSLADITSSLSDQKKTFDLIINAIGTLHTEGLKPEKRLLDISQDSLQQYFDTNTIIPALLIKYFPYPATQAFS